MRRWVVSEIELLGTDTDVSVAKIIGVSADVVGRVRRTLGIPKYKQPDNNNGEKRKWRRWTKDEDELLGTASDAEVAARIGRTYADVAHRRRHLGIANFREYRWTKDADDQLGVLSDRSLAKKLGVAIATVTRRRVRLGIQTCPRVKWGTGKKRIITDGEVAEIARRIDGGETMQSIADERGVSRAAIHALLKRRLQ